MTKQGVVCRKIISCHGHIHLSDTSMGGASVGTMEIGLGHPEPEREGKTRFYCSERRVSRVFLVDFPRGNNITKAILKQISSSIEDRR